MAETNSARDNALKEFLTRGSSSGTGLAHRLGAAPGRLTPKVESTIIPATE